MTPATAPLVLNVNDHAANLYMITKMLSNAGFRVAEATTGAGALARAREPDRPALIVLDVRLPDLSGLEVSRQLRADPRTTDIKILHTSAMFVSMEHKIEGLEAGADGYLTQPFEPQDLIATVRSLIRLHEAEHVLVVRNEQLTSADRRKDEFLAMLAHELRNPLAALAAGLPLIERHPPHDAIEARTREIMRRQITNLTQLVDDLLDVSRVTRGRIDLKLVDLDLGALVVRVADGMGERVLAPRQQQLGVTVPRAPVLVQGDSGRLEQILTNLVDNASKYSDVGTTIDVALEVVDLDAVLSVTDHGIGIDAKTLPHVFELFTQATTSLARSRGGLGIGLTLVHTLVQMHGGTITAASPGLGKGTRMVIVMPLHVAYVERPAAPAPLAHQTGAPVRVLLVDDNADGRDMLRELIELDGHAVREAADGAAGVEEAIAHPPELAFIDIGLPGIDGYEVARQIRAAPGGGAPLLVALSGYGSAQDRERALAAGFDEHIAKPISTAQLKRLLAHPHRR